MKTGITAAVIFRDDDLIKIRVSGCNGVFAGASDVYVGIGTLSDAAGSFKGFPKSRSDVREMTLGEFGRGSAGGAIRLRLHCVDAACHIQLGLTIEADHLSDEQADSATFAIRVEAAALDSFLEQLCRLDSGKAAVADLQGTVYERR